MNRKTRSPTDRLCADRASLVRASVFVLALLPAAGWLGGWSVPAALADEDGDHVVSAATTRDEAEHEGGGSGVSLLKLIEPTGIATLSLVAATVFLGYLKGVKRFRARLVLRIHKITGVCALAAGVTHATLVIVLH